MNNMDDLNNLLDNFDLHAFWDKKKLAGIVFTYVVVNVVTNVFLTRAIIKLTVPGATPKGMKFDASTPSIVR